MGNIGFVNGDTGRRIFPCRVMLPPKPGDECFNEYTHGFRTEDVELMQFTGLKDKNGVEIYEGDLVKWLGWKGYSEVIYKDAHFLLSPNLTLSEQFSQEYEVSGNVWENPELLTPHKGEE